jgi:hypothetical protein
MPAPAGLTADAATARGMGGAAVRRRIARIVCRRMRQGTGDYRLS